MPRRVCCFLAGRRAPAFISAFRVVVRIAPACCTSPVSMSALIVSAGGAAWSVMLAGVQLRWIMSCITVTSHALSLSISTRGLAICSPVRTN
ncbi:hypothetical protein BC831DRAFT_471438, partial [Entophlyctis helioformis]